MCPTLFTSRSRDDKSPALHNEPTSTFLDRVAGDYWDQVRDQLEGWIEHYPAPHVRDVIGRLRSSENAQWLGAFWELYLYESFVRSELEVEIHPTVPGGPRPPDFLVRGGSEGPFYVEAKSVFGPSDGSGARLNTIYDIINAIKVADFFVAVEVESVGAEAPPTRRLRSGLRDWLKSLDADDIRPSSLLDPDADRWTWTEGAWRISFRPLPVRAEARGRPHRLIGMWSPRAGFVDDETPLRDALKEKGAAYGELEYPLVLAVNGATGFDRSFETINALYGSAQVTFSLANPGEARETRATNGYWGYPGGWKHRHVAGVLAGSISGPESVTTNAPTLWLHPDPVQRIVTLAIWSQVNLEGDRIETSQPARPLGAFFGLPEGWPLGDPFPRDL